MINRLKSEDFHSIRADYEGYDKPEKYGGHIPDITAKKNNTITVVVEAETPDSVDEEETKDQLQALSSIPNTKFWIIVPKEIASKLKGNLKNGIFIMIQFFLYLLN